MCSRGWTLSPQLFLSAPFLRDGETTTKTKLASLRGLGVGGREDRIIRRPFFFSWKRHDNKILKVLIYCLNISERARRSAVGVVRRNGRPKGSFLRLRFPRAKSRRQIFMTPVEVWAKNWAKNWAKFWAKFSGHVRASFAVQNDPPKFLPKFLPIYHSMSCHDSCG